MGIGRRPGRPDSLSRVLDAQRLSVRGRIEAFVRLLGIGSIIPKIGDQGFDGGLGARVGTGRWTTRIASAQPPLSIGCEISRSR
ncbi:MAG: hypothetical protein RLZZ34_1432 [Verrucomicrobiota bacterium]|jgi:hypothetical protein